jgi:hypothetical protein
MLRVDLIQTRRGPSDVAGQPASHMSLQVASSASNTAMYRISSRPHRIAQQLHHSLKPSIPSNTRTFAFVVIRAQQLIQPRHPLLIPTPRATHAARITRTMSSDADYASFLDKANQDTGGAQQQSSSSAKKSYGTKSVDTAVPKALEQVEEYYVSDADEPFEPVALAYDGSVITAGTVTLRGSGKMHLANNTDRRFEEVTW